MHEMALSGPQEDNESVGAFNFGSPPRMSQYYLIFPSFKQSTIYLGFFPLGGMITRGVGICVLSD